MADGMAAVLDSLGIDKAIVGGFSAGGTIAAAFYDEYPERTLGLLLEDGGAAMWLRMRSRQDREELRRMVNAAFERQLPRYESEFELVYAWMRDQTTEISIEDVVRRLGRPPVQDSEGRWLWRNERYREWYGTGTAERRYAGYTNFPPPELFQSPENSLDPKIVFRNLRVPMLIIDPVSANDGYEATEDILGLMEEHPILILHSQYENTPHAAKIARPQRFIEDVRRLVAKVQEGTGDPSSIR